MRERELCLKSVPCLVTDSMNQELTRDFTNDDIKKALHDIPANRAPGHDSIPPELLRELWTTVGEDITEFVLEALSLGRLEADIHLGILTLIPKGGTLASVRNYRPISILTGIYKLLAKSLANRIQPFLPICVLPTQTAFVKDRCILDNVYLAQEAVEWARESSQDLVTLFLDFEKAYDRVSWSFLEATMAKLGFSQKWITWTATLYRGAQSSLIVNGKRLRKFDITRSVRQGCPMAPYLYLFISDVLAHMVNDPDYDIQGLRLPDGSVVRSQCFADDTALYLHGSKENLQKVFDVINLFCCASGAKLNWDKSVAVWVSDKPRDWQWGEELGLDGSPRARQLAILDSRLAWA